VLLFQVSLPNRTCKVHRLKLSEDEQAVYDVVFAQSRYTMSLNSSFYAYSVHFLTFCVHGFSYGHQLVFFLLRSTLQNYLKRHEEGNTKKADNSNPFEKGKQSLS